MALLRFQRKIVQTLLLELVAVKNDEIEKHAAADLAIRTFGESRCSGQTIKFFSTEKRLNGGVQIFCQFGKQLIWNSRGRGEFLTKKQKIVDLINYFHKFIFWPRQHRVKLCRSFTDWWTNTRPTFQTGTCHETAGEAWKGSFCLKSLIVNKTFKLN